MTRPARQIDDQADVLADPGAHRADRPFWRCAADGEDWPCARLRAHLLATTDRQDIGLVMGAMYATAARELQLEPRLIHNRFFAWHQHTGWRPPGGMW